MAYPPIPYDDLREAKVLFEDTPLSSAKEEPTQSQSSCFKKVFNRLFPSANKQSAIGLSLATFGPGMLTLPYAFAESGILLGIAQVSICAVLTYYSMLLITKCCNLTKKYSYSDLALMTYGRHAQSVVNLIFFLNNWGTLVLYTLFASNLLASLVHLLIDKDSISEYISVLHSTLWPIIFTGAIVIPLSFAKKFVSLRYSNIVCLILAIYIMILVLVKCFETSSAVEIFRHAEVFNLKGLQVSFPIIMFNYSYQSNIPTLLGDAEDTCFLKTKEAIKSFVLSASMIYLIIGIFGYCLFVGDTTALTGSKNIAQSLASRGWLLSSAFVTIFAIISTTFAMIYIVRSCKKDIKEFLHSRGYLQKRPFILGGWMKGSEYEQKTRDSTQTIVILITQMLFAIFVQRMIEMVDILGIVTLPLLGYVIPCLFYLKLGKGAFWSWDKVKCHMVNIAIGGICLFYLNNYLTKDRAWEG